MKICWKIGVILVIVMGASVSFAQNNPSVNELIKQGQVFSDRQNYTEAIVKYKEALAAEPENGRANYEIAFALYAINKGTEGVPYLEKIIKQGQKTTFTAGVYSLLGSIYSAGNQLQKAIEAYRSGISIDNSTSQRLYYNLGIAQYKAKQYADAEQSFISAVKIDTAYAAAQRMYALVTFHQNKRAEALLGFCRFLFIDPEGPQSTEAFGNLQSILNGGALKPEPGYKPSADVKLAADEQNRLFANALNGFTSRRYASSTDLFTAQLKSVFVALMAGKSKFYFADYFYNLSQTEHLPTFARLISQNSRPANAKWVKDNPEKVAALEGWVKANKIML